MGDCYTADTRYSERMNIAIYKAPFNLYTIQSSGRAMTTCHTGSTSVSADYPRDLIGYASNPPHPRWPGDARIALSFVLNYEEGGERCVLYGAKESEAFISEMVAAQPLPGVRNMRMESLYEYGSSAAVWLLSNLFDKHDIPLTIFSVLLSAHRPPQPP